MKLLSLFFVFGFTVDNICWNLKFKYVISKIPRVKSHFKTSIDHKVNEFVITSKYIGMSEQYFNFFLHRTAHLFYSPHIFIVNSYLLEVVIAK